MVLEARRLALLLGVVFISVLGGCGSSTSDETGVRIGESSDWIVQSVTQPRTLKVGTEVDYCVGDPKPRIGRPKVKYQGDDVFITVTLEKPPARLAKPNDICAGIELFVGRTITLNRNLDDVEVFDGGLDPPQQRWPL